MTSRASHRTSASRTAQLRWGAVLVLVACALVFVVRGRGRAATPPVANEAQVSSSLVTAVLPAPRAPADAPLMSQPPTPPPAPAPVPASAEEQQGREHAILDGVRRFQRDAMPILDGCLGPTPGMRKPVRVIVTFRRDEKASGDSGMDRFVAADVQAPPQHAGVIEPTGPVGRCLHGLEGRPLSIAAGNAPEGNELRQVLTLFLPE